ncbi:HU family DNA-binding protein [Paracoccus sp. ME4]|uniref:HU family DNA-binding protein n=1 Tax=Paracoccus sp. ME4 TaxID=3138066 RepID=UPI00398B869C
MSMLKKADYVAALAEKIGSTKADAAAIVDAIAEITVEAAKSGEPVLVPGIGKLTVIDKPAGTARNPRTGETMDVPARKAPKVSIGKALKDAVSA